MINVEKSQPAPVCLAIEKLKSAGDYKCGDVIERLKIDFKNKCYICEEKAPSTINVEHFIPHKGNIDLKYDWNNLFFACGHCNNTKSDIHVNILNCTHSQINILEEIQFEIKPIPKEKVKISALSSRTETENTVKLLDAVYNGTTVLKNLESENIRNKLIKEMNLFSSLLLDFFDEEDDKDKLREQIKKKLSKGAAFTAFKVWVIKSNPELLEEFEDLLI